jgi:hypothetical protein
MNYFYDQLEKIPGITPLRVDESDGSHMGGYYSPHLMYDPAAFGGLSSNRFAEAVTAEFNGAFRCRAGGNFCLHTHRYFKDFDPKHSTTIGMGTPEETGVNSSESLEASEDIACISAPWFKHYDKEWIDRYAEVFFKVARNYTQLLEDDLNKKQGGIWYGAESDRKK